MMTDGLDVTLDTKYIRTSTVPWYTFSSTIPKKISHREKYCHCSTHSTLSSLYNHVLYNVIDLTAHDTYTYTHHMYIYPVRK